MLFKRVSPRQHLEKNQSKTKDVGSGIDGETGSLLRGHISQRSHQDSGRNIGIIAGRQMYGWLRLFGELRKTKIEDLYISVRPDHYVLWFDIAVNYPGSM